MASAKAFVSYSRDDLRMCERLVKHLSVLEQNNVLELFVDQRLESGSKWIEELKAHFQTCNVVLLCISAGFFASPFIRENELQWALGAANSGTALVIPILFRESAWEMHEVAMFQALPKTGRPIERWKPTSLGYAEVVRGLYRTIRQWQQPQREGGR